MSLFSCQKGIGLLEVMVALMLLAIAVLGFSAMQIKSANVSLEADNNTHALEIARDLHERMRINREGITIFEGARYDASTNTSPPDCRTSDCTPAQLAQFDFARANAQAGEFAMTMAIEQCPVSNANDEKRHCIYVAWGEATPTLGTAATDCANGNTYIPNAQCIFMESFSYAR